MIALGQPIAVAVFEWGNYTHAEALNTGVVLTAAGFGLIPYALSQMQLFTFLAIGDARTPAVIMSLTTVVRIALCLIAYAFLPADAIAAAMMAVNAISWAGAVAVAGPYLRTRLEVKHPPGLRHIVSASATIAGLIVASLLASFAADLTPGGPKATALLTLALAVPFFALAYILAARKVRTD